MIERKANPILNKQYVTDIIDNDSVDDVRILMKYDKEIYRHPRENKDIRGAIERVFGELCASHVFQPVTIEFHAPNVNYAFTVKGEWIERYEPHTDKKRIDFTDVMTRIFDSGELISSDNF